MLVSLYVAMGLALGWLRPLWGLAVLVGAVSVTTSLWWQIGFANSGAPLAYMLAFLVGHGARRALPGGAGAESDAGGRAPGAMLLAAALTVTFTLLATLLAVLREHAVSGRILLQELLRQAPSVLAFNPPSLAGELQAALIVISGPLLLLACLDVVRSAAARSLMRRAFACGAVVAVAAPVVQLLLLDPWVRPDKGESLSTGLVGFFQDPHSFAAYLLLIIGFAAGTSSGFAAAGRRRPAATHALLAAAATVVLIGTNSKTGLAMLFVVIVCLATLVQLERRRARGEELTSALLVPSGIVAAAVVATLALVLSPTIRGGAYTTLRDIGARRLAQPLAPDADWQLLLGDRQARWSATAAVIEQRPLWGAGPVSIRLMPLGTAPDPVTGEPRTIPPENTHNYYLQLAAEYGIPALLAFLWLLGTMLTAMWGNLTRHPSVVARGMIGGILSGGVGFLLFGTVSHPMLLPGCQAVFWTLAGLAISSTGAVPDNSGGVTRS